VATVATQREDLGGLEGLEGLEVGGGGGSEASGLESMTMIERDVSPARFKVLDKDGL
jgi:hypothetical protein